MAENKMNQFFISKINSGQIAEWFFIIGAIASILWSLYFARVILITPYQIGFREGAPQVIMQMLLNGENFSTFDNQPTGYYIYGIGYQAAVFPFAFIFGNTLHIHRFVTLIFILLSTLTGFWIVFQRVRKLSIALICSAFIITAFMGWGGIGSAPTTVGTFLFLIAIFTPYLRSFDTTSIVFSAIFALMAFHTKAYFVLSFGIVTSYLFLFVSKKKGLVYFISFMVLFLVSFIVLRNNLPLYFVNLFYGNSSYIFRTFKHLYTQLLWLSIYFFPVLILTAIMLQKEIQNNKKASFSTQIVNTQYDFLNLNKPLVVLSLDYYLYVFIVSLVAFVFILGSHVGNYLAYAYEIVIPTFLFWFFVNFYEKKALTGFSVLAILINLFYWQYLTLNPQMLAQRNSVGWERVYSYLKPSMNILNSPTITSRLIELGIQPVDSGQTEYYYYVKPYPDNFLMGPSYQEFYSNGLEYINSINNSIIQQEYDLIITTKDVDVFYDLDLISEHYTMIDQLILYMYQTEQKWVVQIWEPLQK